jgi:flagellar protein FliJ
MKKFNFRLDRVVDVRRTKEKECQRELAQSQAEYQRQLLRLQEVAEASDQSNDHLRTALCKKTLAGELNAMHGWSQHQDYELQMQSHRTQEQVGVVEERRGALVQASKDKKVLEKLRERRLTEYHLEAEREAQAFLDELGCRIGRSWKNEMEYAEDKF